MARPRADPAHKKTARSIKLPEWLWQWIDAQDGYNRATLIEDAIEKAFSPPKPPPPK